MFLFEFFDSFLGWVLNRILFLLGLGEEDFIVNRFFRGFIFWFWFIVVFLKFLLWDVLVGDLGMVGRLVGDDDKGGFFFFRGVYFLFECWWNIGEEVFVLSWNLGVVNKFFFLDRFIVKMVGELWMCMICLFLVFGLERFVIGIFMFVFDWCVRVVRIGELFGGLEIKGLMFDRVFWIVCVVGCVSFLLVFVFENFVNVGWFKFVVILDFFICLLIVWVVVVSGVGDFLGMNCGICFCDIGLFFWILFLYGFGLFVGFLLMDGLLGVLFFCFLVVVVVL